MRKAIDRAVIALRRRARQRQINRELAAIGVPARQPRSEGSKVAVRVATTTALAVVLIGTPAFGYGEYREKQATEAALERASGALDEAHADYYEARAAAVAAYTVDREANGHEVSRAEIEGRFGLLSPGYNEAAAEVETPEAREKLYAVEAARQQGAEANDRFGEALEANQEADSVVLPD